MSDHLDHAVNGQAVFNGAGTLTGKFYGLKVNKTTVVSAMSWGDSYGEKCDGDWSDWSELPPGYYPGRFTSITFSSGEGALYKE